VSSWFADRPDARYSAIRADLNPSESPARESRLPDTPVSVSSADAIDVPASSLLEKLSAAVAALLMLDVFAVVLSLARDCGRTFCSLRFRTVGLRFSSRGNADGVGREEDWPGSGERLDFDRLKAVAISLNAVGGEVLSTLVRGVPVT